MERSPIAKLPPELRNTILSIVLQRPGPIAVNTRDPPITFTCRQLRDEALSVLYSAHRRMTLRIPHRSNIRLDLSLEFVSTTGKLRYLEYLEIAVEMGEFAGPSPTDGSLTGQEQCLPLAHILAGHLGLTFEQVQWYPAVARPPISVWQFSRRLRKHAINAATFNDAVAQWRVLTDAITAGRG
ncbi:hypothetical protein LTR86_010049 [Recurvomyces mirabilis]|nr:hypothetical protein LTR86_010049 [Recurvomyces mirabilis]